MNYLDRLYIKVSLFFCFLSLSISCEKDYTEIGTEIVESQNIEIINQKDRDICNLLSLSDFYSLSEFRDLIFHKMEHQFNITQLEKIISKYNLRFIGFQNINNLHLKFINFFKTDKYFCLVFLLLILFDSLLVWIPIDSGLPGIFDLL